VCPEDPGVPNWLDTEGHLEGTMYLRWTYCKNAPETIYTRVVPFNKIWDHMPEDTPLISPEERVKNIASRQAMVNSRYRP
jgi:hypothetical protein